MGRGSSSLPGRTEHASIRVLALVSPPVAPALDVFARVLAEIGRADDDDLEALRPGLVASPRAGRDAYRVPLLELDDLVVELHPPAPVQDHVHLLLLLVRVAVRKAIAGRDALVAQPGLLEFQRLGRQAELQVRRAVESRPDVLQVILEVPEREGHRRDPMCPGKSLIWCVKRRGQVSPGAALQAVDLRRRRQLTREELVLEDPRVVTAESGAAMIAAPVRAGSV